MGTRYKQRATTVQINQAQTYKGKIQFLGTHTGAKILNLSKNSHFENLTFHKIHILKISFFTKFTFFKYQNLRNFWIKNLGFAPAWATSRRASCQFFTSEFGKCRFGQMDRCCKYPHKECGSQSTKLHFKLSCTHVQLVINHHATL